MEIRWVRDEGEALWEASESARPILIDFIKER